MLNDFGGKYFVQSSSYVLMSSKINLSKKLASSIIPPQGVDNSSVVTTCLCISSCVGVVRVFCNNHLEMLYDLTLQDCLQ